MDTTHNIDKNNLPIHIAVIMDGNGRWATQKGLPRTEGHKNAIIAVRDTIEAAAELKIKYLTLYTFSTENWNRPTEEVHALMSLLVDSIEKETPTMMKNNIRFKVIGDMERMPEEVLARLNSCIDRTSDNTGLTLTLALSYSSRWEITSTVKQIARQAAEKQLNSDDINEHFISQSLKTKEYPDPDLLIRTGGEKRISNFLLWQIAYTELYFSDIYWPDFRRDHLYAAIADYQKRQRRFGLTETQTKKTEE